MYTRSSIRIGKDIYPIISKVDSGTKPILLVCGGGPGIPQYLLEYLFPSVIDEFFSVVYFDYRGTGLFPNGTMKAKDMTTECYLNDIKALAEYFIAKEKENKIYIMGHSFGSYMALLTVKNYPGYFKAYISMSQICNQYESECLAWAYMVNLYRKNNLLRKAGKLEKYDIRNNPGHYRQYVYSPARDTSMHDLGVGTTREMRSPVREIFFPSLKCKMYSVAERIAIWRRKFQAANFPVSRDAMKFNAFSEVRRLEVPVYFLAGKHDYTCNVDLQRKYFETLYAPDKLFFLYEEAAHSPLYENPDKSRLILSEIITR